MLQLQTCCTIGRTMMGRLDRCLYASLGPCTVFNTDSPNTSHPLQSIRVMEHALAVSPRDCTRTAFEDSHTHADVSWRSMLTAFSGICRRRTTKPRTLEGRTGGPCVSSRSKTTLTTKVSRMHSLCDSPRSIHPCSLFLRVDPEMHASNQFRNC